MLFLDVAPGPFILIPAVLGIIAAAIIAAVIVLFYKFFKRK